jgi:hypothetical protein
MTKKQRAEHAESIVNTLRTHCGEPDRWGHFKVGTYRFKLQKISMRLEHKEDGEKTWFKCSSAYFKDITIDGLVEQIDHIKKRSDGSNV